MLRYPEHRARAAIAVATLCVLAVCAGPLTAAPEAGTAPYDEQAVDEAVDRGLAYLAVEQGADGAFPGPHGRTTGVVGLCGMGFLAKGYTPGHGRFGEVLDRCIDYILKSAGKNGYLGTESGKMYSHSIATLFLLEVSGMVDANRQKSLDDVIPRAVKVLLAAQQVKKQKGHEGGWRYGPDSNDSDMSCTGWALMALRSARLNGVPVPDKAIDDAVAYVRRHFNPSAGTFGYQDTSSHSVTLSGAGLLSLELTGHHGEKETLLAGNYILKSYDQLPAQSHALYGNYYNAQAMFQLGGKYWERYAAWMYDFWLPRQNDDGSWNGSGRRGARGHRADNASYNTAMMILALTVPYRQLPIYQRDETVDEESE